MGHTEASRIDHRSLAIDQASAAVLDLPLAEFTDLIDALRDVGFQAAEDRADALLAERDDLDGGTARHALASRRGAG